MVLLTRSIASLFDVAARLIGFDRGIDLHTKITFRAIVDAVVPHTPELGAELGPTHVPGGLAINLDRFLPSYIDRGFQFGLPVFGPRGNIPLAEPIANALDAAALTLIDRGLNTSPPSVTRPVDLFPDGGIVARRVKAESGMFARLSREDRLRAIGLLDEFEFTIAPVETELFEFDAGLTGQLVIGFTEMIYYSEWAGYTDFDLPPTLRTHPNDSAAVQSWRQTGYPGFSPGYAALRGYLGKPNSTLGDGDQWAGIDEDAGSGVELTLASGAFAENDYDTSGYDEPFPE